MLASLRINYEWKKRSITLNEQHLKNRIHLRHLLTSQMLCSEFTTTTRYATCGRPRNSFKRFEPKRTGFNAPEQSTGNANEWAKTSSTRIKPSKLDYGDASEATMLNETPITRWQSRRQARNRMGSRGWFTKCLLGWTVHSGWDIFSGSNRRIIHINHLNFLHHLPIVTRSTRFYVKLKFLFQVNLRDIGLPFARYKYKITKQRSSDYTGSLALWLALDWLAPMDWLALGWLALGWLATRLIPSTVG